MNDMNPTNPRQIRANMARAQEIVAHDDTNLENAVVPPLFQTSLFTFPNVDAMMATYAGKAPRPVYSRGLNPTVRAFEEKVAALEGAEDALAAASGMAAISSAVLSIVRPGDRLVSVTHVYPDAYRFFETFLDNFGVSVSYVDGRDEGAVAEAVHGAKVLYLESPNSWMMETHDLARLAEIARAAGAVTIADNSWATPVFQRPLALGVDMVVHSASKYISGHSDTVAGVIAGPAARINKVRGEILPYLGAKLGPFEAWLLLRGLRTLPTRLAEHERAALTLAERLAAHPAVSRVHHPRLAGPLSPGLEGTSGLFSIELADDVDIKAFCDGLRLFKLGVSWGGHESLVCPALVTRVQVGGPNPTFAFGVPERMVRLHVGLEGTEALWADLSRALEGATIT